MRVFLLDLWLDLREKRLAPVALALLAGIILVPLALATSEPDPPPPPPAVAAEEGGSIPEVATASETEIDSRLDAFDPRDPFEPTDAALAAGDQPGDTAGGTTGGGGGDSAGGGGTGGGTTGGGTTGGGTTGGGTTGGGTTGGGTTGGGTERRTVFFTYTADVLFGEFGEERNVRGLERLRILPDEDNPVVVFLGVTTSGKTAVFLVDQGVEASGEGACRPSRDECSFLYLRDEGDRNTALLTDEDGTVYRLTLRDIDRVAVATRTDRDTAPDDDRSGRGERGPAFTGANRDKAPPGEPSSSDSTESKSSFRGPEFADDAKR